MNEPAERSGPGIAVAMLTFRRPAELARALPAVLAQLDDAPAPARLIVVDNSPEASARETVQAVADARVDYRHEPRPGISAARNAALEATADCAAVVFIDDDEVPSPGWLAALVGYWLKHRPAAVAGPVVSTFVDEPDAWVRAAGLFERTTLPTGTRRPGFATNNLLLDGDFLRRNRLRFDDSLGLSGGEDTLLSRQILAAGGEIHWCDEAEVSEPVSAERATRRWVLQRSFRTGSSWARAELATGTSARRLARAAGVLGRVAVRLPAGAVSYAIGTARGDDEQAARGARQTASHAGALLGLAGRTSQEYRRGPG